MLLSTAEEEEDGGMSDYHKQLLKQPNELKNRLSERNKVLLEIMHEYRELMIELNSLTWPCK